MNVCFTTRDFRSSSSCLEHGKGVENKAASKGGSPGEVLRFLNLLSAHDLMSHFDRQDITGPASSFSRNKTHLRLCQSLGVAGAGSNSGSGSSSKSPCQRRRTSLTTKCL
ncbi:hypothetical protein MLD38_016435 [Melastoma candidum]|uniref:Uncharacterized protein n=1 Tax=Melastoma candidum TaxID=119954 RepID=A0ACB9RJG3_9MYRT|nr:hypothetical protein MLD38_016435 [Melastoma candidum]